MWLFSYTQEEINPGNVQAWTAKIMEHERPFYANKVHSYVGWFCWSVFTMYWPQLAFCSLIGKE